MSDGPYSLKAPGGASDGYYRAAAAYTSEWLAKAKIDLARPVSGFAGFLGAQGGIVRSPEEIAFEMLVLGVLLREHGPEAVQLAPAPAWLLARLVEAQDRLPLPAVEKPIKAVRGLLRGLSESTADRADGEADSLGAPAAALVGRLVDWLAAQGAAAQAERMAEWAAFLAGLDAQWAEALLARCLLLAEDFAESSERALGAFTGEVDAFSACQGAGGRAQWRYDGALITRTRVEYHLGMLGSEILTRAFRARYLSMPRKIVIVPDCLCAHSRRADSTGGSCQARRTELGGQCAGCTPGCRVNQIQRLGHKRGFEIYILPDDLRGVGLGSCSKLAGVGVVGVSCALTNWDAGWQVSAAGVPCQGVLLDYAGCKNHWDETGRPTDVNIPKLLETLGC